MGTCISPSSTFSVVPYCSRSYPPPHDFPRQFCTGSFEFYTLCLCYSPGAHAGHVGQNVFSRWIAAWTSGSGPSYCARRHIYTSPSPLSRQKKRKKKDRPPRPPIALSVSPDGGLSRVQMRRPWRRSSSRAPCSRRFPFLPLPLPRCGGLEAGPQRHSLTAARRCPWAVVPCDLPAAIPGHGMASAGLSEQGPPVAGGIGALQRMLLETLGFCARGHGHPLLRSGAVVPSVTARAPARAGLRRGRTSDGRDSRLGFSNIDVGRVPYT